MVAEQDEHLVGPHSIFEKDERYMVVEHLTKKLTKHSKAAEHSKAVEHFKAVEWLESHRVWGMVAMVCCEGWNEGVIKNGKVLGL